VIETALVGSVAVSCDTEMDDVEPDGQDAVFDVCVEERRGRSRLRRSTVGSRRSVNGRRGRIRR